MDEHTYYSYYVSKKKESNKPLKLKIESTQLKTVTDVQSDSILEKEEQKRDVSSEEEFSGVSELCKSLLQNIDANNAPIHSSDIIQPPTSPIANEKKYCPKANNLKTSKLRLAMDIDEMVLDVLDNLSPFTPYQQTPQTPANLKVLWAPPNQLTESTTSPAVDSMLTGSQWWMTPSYNDMEKHPNPVLNGCSSPSNSTSSSGNNEMTITTTKKVTFNL